MANEFDQLFPCSWRGIEFPTTSVEVQFQHDLAEHKYYGVDGARVESTGRGPMNVTVTCPLVNGIVPGKNEKWSVLYPDVFRNLLRASADRKVGTLRHPELDQIECKVRSVEFRHDAQQRDGVTFVAHFVETLVDDIEVEFASPVTVAHLGALDLDKSDADLRGLVPTLGEMPVDITDVFNSIIAIGDRFSVATTLAAGQLARYRYHVGRVEQSAKRARNAVAWPAIDSAQKVMSALRLLEEKPPASRAVLTHYVAEDVTLAALLTEMPGAKLGDVLKLNPHIMGSAAVRAGTYVRYYGAR